MLARLELILIKFLSGVVKKPQSNSVSVLQSSSCKCVLKRTRNTDGRSDRSHHLSLSLSITQPEFKSIRQDGTGMLIFRQNIIIIMTLTLDDADGGNHSQCEMEEHLH